jgi:integrase
MGVYQPKVRGGTTGVWWMRFRIGGRQIRESTGTTRKTVAVEAERVRRLELERALNGLATVESRAARIATVREAVSAYAESYAVNHRAKSTVFTEGRVAHLKRLIGDKLLSDLTEHAVRNYIRDRLAETASNRTINMEIGVLGRAVAQARGSRLTWMHLWPNVRPLEERSDIGRAITHEEEARLFDAIGKSRRTLIGPFVRIALATGMRYGEILSLTWGQIDFAAQILTVGSKAKTKASAGRRMPVVPNLLEVLRIHRDWFVSNLGPVQPHWFLFPLRVTGGFDPERACTDVSRAWDFARKQAKVDCRFHDLRHTAISRMAEAGIPDRVVMQIAGHVSRAMLARYSHMSMASMRDAMEVIAPNKNDRVSKQIDQQRALETFPTVGMVV